MLEIVKPSVETKEYAYRRIFEGDYERYGFLCDEEGFPIFRSKAEEKQFDKCFTKPNRYKDLGRVKREYTHISPAVARCECGCSIVLSRFKNVCNCGRIYRPNGSEIAM